MKTWSKQIQGWLTWHSSGGAATSSQKQRRYRLQRFAAAMGGKPGDVTAAMCAEYLGCETWGQNTRRAARRDLVGFFAWAQANGYRRDNPAALTHPVKVPAGKPRPAPDRAITTAMHGAPERTYLMLALAAFCGLRRGEIATARPDNLEQDLNGFSLRVTGKGGVVRLMPLSDSLAREVRAFGEGNPGGWLFPGQIDGHLSPAHVGVLVRRVMPEGWSTHTLRHRYASAAYRPERDILAVQQLLGHSSVATTQVYVAIPDDARRRAALAAGTLAA